MGSGGDTDVLIVGAGIAGSVLATTLRERGREVTVVAGDHGQSPAALAIARETYVPKHEVAAMHTSLDWYRDQGVEVIQGAEVSTYARRGVTYDDGWWAVEPNRCLVKPDLDAWVEPNPDGPGVVRAGDTAPITARHVVWCDAGGSGTVTWGCTWVHPDPKAVTCAFAAHTTSPYRTVCVVRFSDHARVGSSSAKVFDTAMRQGTEQFAAACRMGWVRDTEGWERITGFRLRRETYAERTPRGDWRWGGFHRSGYSLAPALAADMADLLA